MRVIVRTKPDYMKWESLRPTLSAGDTVARLVHINKKPAEEHWLFADDGSLVNVANGIRWTGSRAFDDGCTWRKTESSFVVDSERELVGHE